MLKRVKRGKTKERKKITFFSMFEHERERERKKNPNFSLQSAEFHQSEFVRPRMKVHLLYEGYTWVPKTRDFAEDSSEEFGKSKVSCLGSVHGTS